MSNTRESVPSRALPQPPLVGTLARAAGRFALTGELPERPDVAELVLRGAALEVEAALLDNENDRALRARQRLLEAARQLDDMQLQRQARAQLRRPLTPSSACTGPRAVPPPAESVTAAGGALLPSVPSP